MAHKHANAMMEYAMDALQTDAPWQRWEYRENEGSYWRQPGSHPCWFEDCEYRRKVSQEEKDRQAYQEFIDSKRGIVQAKEVWNAALAWERSKK